jgi:hypothetical protein
MRNLFIAALVIALAGLGKKHGEPNAGTSPTWQRWCRQAWAIG